MSNYPDFHEEGGLHAPLGIITALTLSAIIWTILGCVFYYMLNR